MRWIWVRHGETEANVGGCYLGHLDSALTVRGCEQAEIVAEQLQNVGATRLYTSDLGRCVVTASIIAKRIGLELVTDSRLRELNFGQWDGLTYDEVMSLDQELLERWYDNPFTIAPSDGETLNQLGHRIDEWLEETMEVLYATRTADKTTGETNDWHAHETVIVVTHGGPIRWFQSRWLLKDTDSFWKVDSVLPGNYIDCFHTFSLY